MERTKSLSEPLDTKRDSSSPLSSNITTTTSSSTTAKQQQELQRTSSLGLDLICKQLGVSWLRPSSSNVTSSKVQSNSLSSPLSPSSKDLPSHSGLQTSNAQHIFHPHHHRQIQSEGINCNKITSENKFFPNYELIDNLMHELRNQSTTGSLESWLQIIDYLSCTMHSQPFNEQTFCKIIKNTSKFLDSNHPNKVRHKVWCLYTQLVKGQAENVGQYRLMLFDLIHRNDSHYEDIPLRIDFLIGIVTH